MWFAPAWVLGIGWDQVWMWKEEAVEAGAITPSVALAMGCAAPYPVGL